MENEQEDWERELSGKPYPELECALTRTCGAGAGSAGAGSLDDAARGWRSLPAHTQRDA
jgi:hypothetical protein